MKNFGLILILVVFCVINCGCSAHNSGVEGYTLRIEVVADENSAQARKVQGAVVEAIRQKISSHYDQRPITISEEQTALQQLANGVLVENNAEYDASVTAKGGTPSAVLITDNRCVITVRLGRGKGDTWWQELAVKVSGVIYKSRLEELFG